MDIRSTLARIFGSLGVAFWTVILLVLIWASWIGVVSDIVGSGLLQPLFWTVLVLGLALWMVDQNAKMARLEKAFRKLEGRFADLGEAYKVLEADTFRKIDEGRLSQDMQAELGSGLMRLENEVSERLSEHSERIGMLEGNTKA